MRLCSFVSVDLAAALIPAQDPFFFLMKTFAVDFETYYDKECSIKTLGLDGYVRHPAFDAYMVTVVGDDGTRYAGRPEDFDWSMCNGATVLSHNASFDAGVYAYLSGKGTLPVCQPAVWECTSDMAAYLGSPRNLAASSKSLLGVEISKTVRDEMMGQQWHTMTPEFQKSVLEYATMDAELCLRLWTEHSHKWPEHERRISRLTRESGWNGLAIDCDGVTQDIEKLEALLATLKSRIPWSSFAAVLSKTQLNKFLLDEGIEPPACLDKKDPATNAWVEAHPDITWVRDMWDYRSASVLLKKLTDILRRVRLSDGRMGYGMKYAGAHTLRDSGDSGINIQNLPRGEVLGVNLRKRIVAKPGHSFVACDLGAIEPRALTYLARDYDTLEAAKQVSDWYEAQARAWGLYSDERPLKVGDPNLRHMVKGMSIGLGYMMSANKYASVTGKTQAESEQIVQLFRAKNPKIVRLWSILNNGAERSRGGNFSVTLPSGRDVCYHDVRKDSTGTSAVMVKNGMFLRLKIWPGLIVENLTQAFSRDIFMNRVLAVKDAGYNVVLRVHDEVVIEVPDEQAKQAAADMVRIMTTSPDWCQDLPLAAEAKIGKTYFDAK